MAAAPAGEGMGMIEGSDLAQAVLDAYERGMNDGRESVLDEDRRQAYDQYRDLLKDAYVEGRRLDELAAVAGRRSMAMAAA